MLVAKAPAPKPGHGLMASWNHGIYNKHGCDGIGSNHNILQYDRAKLPSTCRTQFTTSGHGHDETLHATQQIRAATRRLPKVTSLCMLTVNRTS
jgi:hypothetical protein